MQMTWLLDDESTSDMTCKEKKVYCVFLIWLSDPLQII